MSEIFTLPTLTNQINFLRPLSYEAKRGMCPHPKYAVSPQRDPPGLSMRGSGRREPRNAQGERGGITESVRWIESYERFAERALELPFTRLANKGNSMPSS